MNRRHFIQTSMVALFGALAPNPWQSNDAVYAALAMRESLAGYSRELQARGLPPLSIGVGLHRGSGVVGLVGSKDLMEFAFVGRTVNVSARVQELTRGQTELGSEPAGLLPQPRPSRLQTDAEADQRQLLVPGCHLDDRLQLERLFHDDHDPLAQTGRQRRRAGGGLYAQPAVVRTAAQLVERRIDRLRSPHVV